VPHNNNAYKLTAIHESVEKKLGKKVELECLKKSPHPLLQHTPLDNQKFRRKIAITFYWLDRF
jgi:hypothetical protein